MASFFALNFGGVRSLFSFFLGNESESENEDNSEDADQDRDERRQQKAKQRKQAFNERLKALRDARYKLFDEGEPPPEKVYYYLYLCFQNQLSDSFFACYLMQVLEHLLKLTSNLGIEIMPQNCVDLKQCVKDRTPRVLTYDNADWYTFDSEHINCAFLSFASLFVKLFLAATSPSGKRTNSKVNDHHFTVLKVAGSSPNIGACGSIELCKETTVLLRFLFLMVKTISCNRSKIK